MTTPPIPSLQQLLQAAAKPDTKAWFERYLRYAITYRGVKTPQVKRLVAEWYRQSGVDQLPVPDQLALAAELIRQPMAEDKLAGTILVQQYLLRQLDASDILALSEDLFDAKAFYDWSTTDWYCMRVLKPIVTQEGAAERIARWKTSPDRWQRRSAIVPFRAVVRDPAYDPLVAGVIKTLVTDEERFVQTGIGWVIADLSRVRPMVAQQLVEQHLHHLSAEVIRRHTRHLPRHQDYRQAKKAV